MTITDWRRRPYPLMRVPPPDGPPITFPPAPELPPAREPTSFPVAVCRECGRTIKVNGKGHFYRHLAPNGSVCRSGRHG